MLYKTYFYSPLGKILIISDENNLKVLELEGQRFHDEFKEEEAIINEDVSILKKTKMWLEMYFKGLKPSIKELSLKPVGSDFRQKVWKILCEIPYGQVITYGDIAKQIAKQEGKKLIAAQAVGNAVGHNPISIIIPCHRVVGTNGSLTGYGGGIENKVKLLELEKVNMKNLYVPTKGTAL